MEKLRQLAEDPFMACYILRLDGAHYGGYSKNLFADSKV